MELPKVKELINFLTPITDFSTLKKGDKILNKESLSIDCVDTFDHIERWDDGKLILYYFNYKGEYYWGEAEEYWYYFNKKDVDKLRSSTLYLGEELQVRYIGKGSNFPNDKPISIKPKMARRTGFPYPYPKSIACDYGTYDLDGDYCLIAEDRYGKIEKDFEWII